MAADSLSPSTTEFRADALRELPAGPAAPALWQKLQYARRPLEFLERSARQFGAPCTVWLGNDDRFILFDDPLAVRDIFRGDGYALHSGEGNQVFAPTVGQNSVLVLDEEPHALQRQLLLPALKGERMRAFHDAMVAETLAELAAWPRGKPFPMLGAMRRITLRVVFRSALGIDPGELLDRLEENVESFLALGRTEYAFLLMEYIPQWLLQARWLPFARRLSRLNQQIYDFLAQRRRRLDEPRRENIVDDLLAARKPDGAPLSDVEIRDAIVTTLIAGYDTTSVALAWAIEQIGARADVVGAICAEVARETGGGPLLAEHVPRLHYLDAVIRESLRRRTIVPFVVRLTKRAFEAGGRTFPAGVLLCPCSHLVHRRPDLYSDPERFVPERFLERKYAAHEWFPFGGGNRICLGMAFAMYEMKVVLATIFSRGRLVRQAGQESRSVHRGILIVPHDGCRAVLAE